MVVVDQYRDYYFQQYGVILSPEQHPDGTVHLVDDTGHLVAVVHPDGYVEEMPTAWAAGEDPERQVCEEPAWLPDQSYADAPSCNPENQSYPLYADDGTQTQSFAKPFAESSPVSSPATPPSEEQPQGKAVVADGDHPPPESSDRTVGHIDGSHTTDAEAGDTVSSAGMTAAGSMEVETPLPSDPLARSDMDVGLPATAQPMSAQLCVAPDAVVAGSIEERASARTAGAADAQAGVSASGDPSLSAADPFFGACAREVPIASFTPTVPEAKIASGGERGVLIGGTGGEADVAGVAIVGERSLGIGAHRSPELATARAAISMDVCTTAAPVFDGQRVPQGIALLGGSAFCIDADAAAIAEAQKGLGGYPHLSTTISQIANGNPKQDLQLHAKVSTPHHRGDSHERHGNGGERDGQNGQEAWEFASSDEDEAMSLSFS